MAAEVDASQRLIAARVDLDKATRTTRLAAINAGDALRRRARRRRRRMIVATVVTAMVVLALLILVVLLPLRVSAEQEVAQRNDDVLNAASAAVTSMLTADPKQAERYADSVISVSVGEQRERVSGTRRELIDEISRQDAASTGVVLSAGLLTDPSDAADATADVLLVAEATNPAIIGGDPARRRMPIVLTMRLVDQVWKVAKARLG
ncbi:hypothetical protein [Gordonia sp. CPCC 205333]|uniref:hypothetical protein n=1 Tax=Gordonia sp. CPCC 205333 TaxID=3140790 RepID=UPI003AF406A4